MRFACAVAVAVLSLAAPVRTYAQTSLDAFGALPTDQLSSFGDSGVPFDFGGRVGFEVLPGVHVMGEFGRLSNVMPDLIATGLGFTGNNLKASAFYGEGGVRLLASPRSAVSPYVEGSAGVAHLQFGVNGLGSATDAIVRAALSFVDTSDPIVGGGGGVLLHGGPLQIDLGYRYKRILAGSTLSSILSAGDRLDVHQLRFGVGVRF
ncbi:MAG TPA: outer membrane beta-barrel protein [Vicinamibacterales bacterium]|nr:outer membrane beta-barrel protein [Vicinamibacterales bacterium]